jgi:spore coat polysaccharide biosynthesis protein SpsF
MSKSKKVGGIILARLDSSRLPNKQLKIVRGRVLLDWLIERAKAIEEIDELVIATSNRAIDDPLEAFAIENGIDCIRGSHLDVAGRVLECINNRKYDAWVRINGDSPLLDYKLFDYGIKLFRNTNYKIVTNAYDRTYPIGNSVEVFDALTFASGYDKMTKDRHYEHVTAYFYEHPEKYNIYNITHENGPKRKYSLAVDTPEDLLRYEWMLDQVGGDHMSLVGDVTINLAAKYSA